MENTTPENKDDINLKFKKPKPIVIKIGAVVVVLIALFFTKGFFIAATVNGSPISRWSVIKELEKQGGKQALEAMIDQKIIKTELDKQKITVTVEEVDGEIKKIEEQVASQGGTLEMALAQQGMTKEKLVEQITVQKKLEKLLADKVVVTDADIEAYIKASEAKPAVGVKIEDFKQQLGEQLKKQKFQTEAQQWVMNLVASSTIKYYGNYQKE